jgi:hypothetical protein
MTPAETSLIQENSYGFAGVYQMGDIQARLPDRWLRLRNYGDFIHQPPPIMQWQIASSGSNAAGVFLSLKRDDEKNDKDRMDHDCRPQ